MSRLLKGLGIFVLGVLLFLWFIGVFGGNIRTVSEGKVYRSAQITGTLLDNFLKEKGIRTVLNLRGGSSHDWWYKAEIDSCTKMSVNHVDAAFSAVRFPPPQVLKKILGVLDHADYPILLHCRGGSDRSGLISTLYLHLYENVSLDEAQARQLTWRFGHLRYGQARSMDEFLDMYRQNSEGMSLRDWILNKYPALYAALPESKKVKEENAPLPTKTSETAAPVRH
jgi:protein tyrosine/serine phosphatase